jgi:DNA-binding LacI/PurR family transcriptional regulator
VTIRKVAAAAGVSAATVSRVFSHPHTVTPETRQRVMAAANELGYTPNPVARSLARGETGNVGVVVPDIVNSFHAVVIKAVQQTARQESYALFVADWDEQSQDEHRVARAMAAQVDGLILASPRSPDERLLELAALTPVVTTNRLVDGVPAVLLNPTNATCQAVEHLHALGHRELVYLAGPDSYSNTVRRQAIRHTCQRLEVSLHELGPYEPRYSSGVQAADLVLARSVTAVIAYNDEIAVGVLNRVTDRGLRVPADLSIVGFDDTALAGMVLPRLTSVRLPAAVAGAAAMRLLLDLKRGDSLDGRVPVELPGELIIRSSTGPAPRSTKP